MWAHVVSLRQRLDILQFKFAAPLVSLLQRGLQDKEQVKWRTPEVEFVARHTAMIGGRNLKLVQVCLSKVSLSCSLVTGTNPFLSWFREHLKGCSGVEGGFLGFAQIAKLTKNP